jgi:hypothetical protein
LGGGCDQRFPDLDSPPVQVRQRRDSYSARVGSTKIAVPVARWFRDLMMPVALGVCRL